MLTLTFEHQLLFLVPEAGCRFLPSLVDEKQTTSTAFTAPASQPTTPPTSSPSLPTFPLPPTTATSSPPTRVVWEKDVLLLQSPVHGNLGHIYSSPSEYPQMRRSVSLSISTGCHLLSKSVELANYMKLLASEKNRTKIQSLSGKCLLNNARHNAMSVKSLFPLLFLQSLLWHAF